MPSWNIYQYSKKFILHLHWQELQSVLGELLYRKTGVVASNNTQRGGGSALALLSRRRGCRLERSINLARW